MCHDHDDILAAFDGGLGVLDDMWMGAYWKPPPQSTVKLNVDGSYRDLEDTMGAGGLLRNHRGEWLVGFAAHKMNGNPLLAEAHALYLGLQMAWTKGYREVICEVDSKELMDKLGDNTLYRFMPILKEINDVIQRNWSISLSHIRREANATADWLAKFGANNSNLGVVEFEVPPYEIETLLLRDSIR